jgi:hypothetical protein
MAEGNFEARKIGMRQNKEGVIISLVVQPDDWSSALAMVPIGARLMIGWSEINDDETKKEEIRTGDGSYVIPSDATVPRPRANEAGTSKDRRPFASLSLPEQCGIRCGDKDFIEFFDMTIDRRLDEAIDQAVRRYCVVTSRSELSTNHEAADKWRKLESEYQAWQNDQRYAGARR